MTLAHDLARWNAAVQRSIDAYHEHMAYLVVRGKPCRVCRRDTKSQDSVCMACKEKR